MHEMAYGASSGDTLCAWPKAIEVEEPITNDDVWGVFKALPIPSRGECGEYVDFVTCVSGQHWPLESFADRRQFAEAFLTIALDSETAVNAPKARTSFDGVKGLFDPELAKYRVTSLIGQIRSPFWTMRFRLGELRHSFKLWAGQVPHRSDALRSKWSWRGSADSGSGTESVDGANPSRSTIPHSRGRIERIVIGKPDYGRSRVGQEVHRPPFNGPNDESSVNVVDRLSRQLGEKLSVSSRNRVGSRVFGTSVVACAATGSAFEILADMVRPKRVLICA